MFMPLLMLIMVLNLDSLPETLRNEAEQKIVMDLLLLLIIILVCWQHEHPRF